ncbi:MAG: putative sugar nucleotidyl transferase [bacterium]
MDCIIVFEDENYSRFYPISLSKPTYSLLSGAKTNLERIKHHFSDFKIFTICRPYLANRSKISYDQFNKFILINGSCVFQKKDLEFIKELKNSNSSIAYVKNGITVAIVLSQEEFRERLKDTSEDFSKKIIEGLKTIEIDILTFSYIWDLIFYNQELIISDFDEYFKDKGKEDNIGYSFIYGREEISADCDISADAFSVIDSREGPVIIQKGVEIKPFTYLKGPAFIGDECKLVGGKITNSCSFGKGCRIGGEIENTIVIGNSNKYHEGFIGHSYIGEWVNLGALATNSDLKNNYSEISVKQNGIITKTKSIKIGCFIGDHTKIGIGITLNTGVVIGFSCNLFGGSLIMEKEIPSFAFGNDSLRHELSLQKAIDTAKIVLERRNFRFDSKHQELFKYIFNESAGQRKAWLKNGC